MPCPWCPADGDESECGVCGREPRNPPPAPSPYYDRKAAARTSAAVIAFLAFLILLAFAAVVALVGIGVAALSGR